ncbi:MAG TPA: TPM domain-containing protein, partial [Syntrophorhabdaceae bacterium]|nr:TPM domain-containing protein [Syntrophorhabdaceae bacterium]
GFIALIITVYALHSSLWLHIPTVFILCFPLKGLFRFLPAMKLPFVSTKRMEKKAMERAIRGFYEKGLYKTRQHTGVLFFISIFERKVWIIADKGIYSKIAQGELNRFAEEISNGIKAGRACDALCVAISEIGKILERHFPTSKNDVNELTDEIIME